MSNEKSRGAQNASPICPILLRRSGLSSDDIAKGSRDSDFEAIQKTLADIHQGKEVLYGN